MDKKIKYPSKSTVKKNTSVPTGSIDLSSLFNLATKALAANQTTLNQADSYNQNHGDNMVQTFNLITQTLTKNRSAAPSQQLAAASRALSQGQMSGSTAVYKQGLDQAAKQFQGQKAITADNAMTLIQALFGGAQQPQPSSTGADLLGSLLGGGQQQQPSSPGADLLGSLLGGGQATAQSAGQQDAGIDMADLLNAGMAFLNAKQQGQSNLQAALTALISNGPMGQSPHRQQSGHLVANTLIQAIAGMASKRK